MTLRRSARNVVVLGIVAAVVSAVFSLGAAAISQAGVKVVAGTGEAGFSGDGGPADRAKVNTPMGLAFRQAGGYYFADFRNHVVREVDGDGIIRTVVGMPRRSGFNGDGMEATRTLLNFPISVYELEDGSLLVTDLMNTRVRWIKDGVVWTAGWSQMGRRGLPRDLGQIALFPPTNAISYGEGYLQSGGREHVIRLVLPDEDGGKDDHSENGARLQLTPGERSPE